MWKEHLEDLERKCILLLWSGMSYKGQLINLVDHVVQFYILTDFLLVLSMTERSGEVSNDNCRLFTLSFFLCEICTSVV